MTSKLSSENNEQAPIELKIVEISPIGIMTIHFSQQLKSYDQLTKEYNNGRNLGEEFLDIQYISNVDRICVPTQPSLRFWYVTKFENTKMEIFLNMTNPVYVSSSDIPD